MNDRLHALLGVVFAIGCSSSTSDDGESGGGSTGEEAPGEISTSSGGSAPVDTPPETMEPSESGSAASGGSSSGGMTASAGETGTGGEAPVEELSNCEGTYDLPQCVAEMAEAGGGTVILAEKTYLLTESLELENDVDIVGQGPGTVIAFDDAVKNTIDEPLLYSSTVDDIELIDFKLQCSIDQDPTSSDFRNDHMGFFLNCSGDPTQGQETGCNNIHMERIEATHCSNGMHLKGVTGITGIDLHLHHNGNTTVDLFHNVYFRRVANIVLIQTTPTSGGYYASNRGHGLRNSHIVNAYWEGLTVYENADHGLHLSDGIYNMRWHNLDVRDNCANPSGGCNESRCYGGGEDPCEIEEAAPQELMPVGAIR